MPTILFIIVFYLLFAFLIRWALRHRQIGLSTSEVFLGLGLKIALGCAYGYIFATYYGGDDTWLFHAQSSTHYQQLLGDPVGFFTDLSIADASEGAVGTWQLIEFYIMDLEIKLLPKLLAIFNLISQGNYYINVVFFNALVFWGHYWLFATFTERFPGKRLTAFLVLFVYIPAVFWLSGIRSDGLLLMFFSMAVRSIHLLLRQKKLRFIWPLVVGLIGITIFRSAWLPLVVIPLVCWVVCERTQFKKATVFTAAYILCGLLFFASAYFSPQLNLPQIVSDRQASYFKLNGNTRFELDTLEPTPIGFAKLVPRSVLNTYVRPYPWESKGVLQLMTSAENLLLFVLLFLVLFRPAASRKQILMDPMVVALTCFAITLYLFIGFTVPFPGAIVRYKVVGCLLVVLFLASSAKWTSKRIK